MRKDEVRIHHTLSNGQHIALYFELTKNVLFDDGYEYDSWYVGVRIDDSRRACNDWWNRKRTKNRLDSTGRCGLEGLMWAKNQILKFVEEHAKEDFQKIVVGGEDERRLSAYRFLKRYGFEKGVFDGEETLLLEF